MLAFLEDELGDRRVPVRLRVSLAAHGLAERVRSSNAVAATSSSDARRRNGSLRVLVAWAAFMVGGAGFAKATEHFDRAVPAGSQRVPEATFAVVAIGGVLGGCMVLAGAALAMPAFITFVRNGGWPRVKRHLVRALIMSTVTVAATLPLLAWAHRLNDVQRNGASSAYSAAFLGWVLLGVITLGCWTAVAASIGRHVGLRASILRIEAALAMALAATMLAISLAAVTWWLAIARSAPWFLHGKPADTPASPFNVPLTLALVVMTGATILGLVSATRILLPKPTAR
jgi:hypothetical protein